MKANINGRNGKHWAQLCIAQNNSVAFFLQDRFLLGNLSTRNMAAYNKL
jgi:hypothetical protein